MKYFFFAFACGQLIYEGLSKPIDEFYNALLYEKSERRKEQFTDKPLRNMILDENMKKVLMPEVIQCLIDFNGDLQRAFMLYMAENFENFAKTGEIVSLSHHRKEIIKNILNSKHRC